MMGPDRGDGFDSRGDISIDWTVRNIAYQLKLRGIESTQDNIVAFWNKGVKDLLEEMPHTPFVGKSYDWSMEGEY